MRGGSGARALHDVDGCFARRVTAELLVRQTDCLLMAQRPADASETASAALAADPGRLDAVVHIAWARACRGEMEQGARDLEKAAQAAEKAGDQLAAQLAAEYLDDLHSWTRRHAPVRPSV